MSAKQKMMGCYSPKYLELDQTLLEWFLEQKSPGKSWVFVWDFPYIVNDRELYLFVPEREVLVTWFIFGISEPRRLDSN